MIDYLHTLVVITWAMRYVIGFVAFAITVAFAIEYREQRDRALDRADELAADNAHLRAAARTRYEIPIQRPRVVRGPVIR